MIISFREFRVITTLVIILGLVTGLYIARWLYEVIKKWKESMRPQPIETISGTVNDPANKNVPTRQVHPHQPVAAAIQLNNQAFNPQIVNGVYLIMSCTVIIVILAMVIEIQPEISNERLRKFRPLIGITSIGTLLLCIFYRKNPSLRNFVREMYFQ